MKYLKNLETGEVFAFESDGSQDAFIPPGLVEMTDKEVSDHLAPPVLTEEQLRANAGQERDSLLARAAIRIAPLQDAVDLKRAPPGTEELLAKWKNYRVDLNEISTKPGFPELVEWPVQPS